MTSMHGKTIGYRDYGHSNRWCGYQQQQQRESVISSFRGLGSGTWRRSVARSVMALEAAEILKIKPSTWLARDVQAWAFERNGHYSVRSAYKLLKADQMATAKAASNETDSSEQSGQWSSVWRLDVPPKIRVFWWRVMHNSLPSKSELKRRHVEKESYCEVCGDPDECLYHMFFLCPVAQLFWQEVKLLSGIKVPMLHPDSWTTDIFKPEICPSRTTTWLVCGAWSLWNGRNNRRHGRKAWEPAAMARFISSVLEDLASLKQPGRISKPPRDVKWRPPETGWFKVNTDAGFVSDGCTGSAGVVIRDYQGAVCAGAARWFDDISDALTAEAIAAKEGVELAIELGYDRVLLEVDSKNLKTMLEERSNVKSSIGGLCYDIMELSRSFSEFRVEWVCREANSVSHCCAGMVTATERSFFWMEEIPEWLSGLALADCNPTLNE